MKVVCESCQAKYQVPDERVAGKKLKIRCKRCGNTVLIRGDLAQSEPVAPMEPMAQQPFESHGHNGADEGAPPVEWHISLDGETRGPFDIEEIRIWLAQQPGAWDAHVWREGFPDWIEARNCAELGPPPAAYPEQAQEDEAPTQTFDTAGVAPFMAQAAAGSSIRSRAPSGISAGSSPRISAQAALTGERHEDSVLFSARNLQTMTGAPTYTSSQNPGFAGGEGSGLIDIRALASLARQNQPRLARTPDTYAAPEGNGFSFGNEAPEDDDARDALMNQTSAFSRVDSLAPVSTPTKTSNVAVPLAILGGCALVAAAVFAAILIARPSRPPEPVAVTVPDTSAQADSVAATAQPTPETSTEEAKQDEPAGAESEGSAAGEHEAEESSSPAPTGAVMSAAKARRQPRGSRTASDEKKTAPPEEKSKPKKEEKSEPPSIDDVMLADQPKAKKEASDKPEKSEPAKGSDNSDIDSLLDAKPAAKPQPQKDRSLDDLLSGAVDSKSAPKPAPAAASANDGAGASDLPPSPSRDETLAAMRGVESAVHACATGQSVTGTAQVEVTVSGSTGRVTSANVTGITGAVGSCIARAARNAKFPRFSKPTFTIKFPYRF